jgi:hypothetical protein
MSGIYDAVQNPIPRSKLFVTVTLEEATAIIEAMPSRERAIAWQTFWMVANACHQLVEDKILSKEIFA